MVDRPDCAAISRKVILFNLTGDVDPRVTPGSIWSRAFASNLFELYGPTNKVTVPGVCLPDSPTLPVISYEISNVSEVSKLHWTVWETDVKCPVLCLDSSNNHVATPY